MAFCQDLYLIILSATAMAGMNSLALMYSLIRIVLFTTIGVIFYHIHIFLYCEVGSVLLAMITT